jgi:ParB/RepB/Spo0J family partition protein
MKGKFAVKPLAALKRQPIRLDLGMEAELKAIAQSWLNVPIHPIIVRPDLTIADGHRRVAGLELLGVNEVDVFITDDDLTDGQLVEIALLSAVHRKGLSDYERVQAMKRIAAAHPDWSKKRLAEHLDMDPSMVTKMLPAGEPIPAVEDAFKAGRIGIGDRYNISLLPPAEQPVPLELKLSGASRDEVARESRKRRNGNGAPAVRTSRIRIPLATETATGTVTLAGDAIDLEDAENLLKEALKAIRSAKDKGLNSTTAQKVWKDMAAAGGGA